ncbi:hypothetical protein [Paracoccus sp. J55]|uniref:hypothetical protein n=1 Tax=Paracoccus sp. J55 TaxID=935849 RepID=UPI0004909D0A|nr:hypothetical protein [Paracoccus sp. J55]
MRLQSLWSQMSGLAPARLAAGAQIVIIDGQSLALGCNASPEERRAHSHHARAAVRQLDGLCRPDGVAVRLHGPGSLGYDARHATGHSAAVPLANVPAAFSFSQALDLWRRRLGIARHRMFVGCHSIAGTSIHEFDRDPAHGRLGTTIRDNHARWLQEALRVAPGARPLVYGMIQGEANIAMSAPAYRAAAARAYGDALDDIEALTGIRPPLMLWQTGGYVNAAAARPYGPVLAQLDLVRDFDAIFAGPLYPVLTFDNAVHPDLPSQLIHCEIAAYVFARREQGRNVNLLPGRPVWQGNTLRIPFSTEDGKPLIFDPDSEYPAYGGLADHGVEAAGARITDVALDGNAVVVTCDGPMTRVQIALQAADMSAHADARGRNHGAHRCDIIEADPPDSLLLPGRKLKRFIPSCRFQRP